MTKPKIRCQWAEQARFVVNPDGQVWPCCYFANFTYLATTYTQRGKADQLFEGHKRQMNDPLVKQYFEDPDRHNAFKRPVQEILDDEWFNKSLPESWDSESTLHYQCGRMCRVKDE